MDGCSPFVSLSVLSFLVWSLSSKFFFFILFFPLEEDNTYPTTPPATPNPPATMSFEFNAKIPINVIIDIKSQQDDESFKDEQYEFVVMRRLIGAIQQAPYKITSVGQEQDKVRVRAFVADEPVSISIPVTIPLKAVAAIHAGTEHTSFTGDSLIHIGVLHRPNDQHGRMTRKGFTTTTDDMRNRRSIPTRITQVVRLIAHDLSACAVCFSSCKGSARGESSPPADL